MKFLIWLPVLIALSGCFTPQGEAVRTALHAIRGAGEEANDKAMDAARQFHCNNTYRAEMAARDRWHVPPDIWNAWCGREPQEPGR